MSDKAKSVSASLDVLQDYFDDLLTPVDVLEPQTQPLEQTHHKVMPLQPEPQEEVRFNRERENAYRESSQHVAERLAKSRLSRLLTSVAEVDDNLSESVAPTAVDAPLDRTVVEALPESVATEPRESNAADTDSPPQQAQVSESDDHRLAWLDNGRPAWAQDRFEVLLFEVSGLTLAVPLITLGQIQPLTDELTPLFGQADWFMGLQPTSMGQVNTVNTAKFVMPERYDEAFLKTAKYVVSIDGLPWGLAVCAVNQPISLVPEDVNWRSDRSKRPWLAGTVKEQRCALLDIPTMGKILQDLDSNGGRGR